MITLTWTLATDTLTEKNWLDQTGKYRVTWRSHFQGVAIIPKYVACELTETEDGRTCWDIVSKHREFLPAQNACQKRARQRVRDAKKIVPKKRKRRMVERGSLYKPPKR